MGYTQFYREVKETPDKITWKDIFSEFRQKHTKEDMEYAFLAGTSMDRTNETNMLHKWKKPWIFWRVLLIFLAAAGVNQILMEVGKLLTGSVNVGTIIISQLLLPMIVPAVLMIFFWELNIPRNISVYELITYLVLGGMVSFFVTNLLSVAVPYNFPDYIGGPFREEPAKLAASVLLLYFFRKKDKKIYGMTGLVIGAAVGTGFGIFESITYVLENEWQQTAFLRMLGALTGHTFYTAPYVAAIALHMKENRFQKESFLNKDFGLAFFGGVGAHMIWNSGLAMVPLILLGINNKVILVLEATLIVGLIVWSLTLSMTRKCLQQAVRAGRYIPQGNSVLSTHPAPVVSVQCVSGPDQGRMWHSQGRNVLTVGCYPECAVALQKAPGVSRSHCSIQLTHQGWTVKDLNSSYGTYLENGEKVSPGMEQKLRSGTVIYLGSRNVALRIILNSGSI